MYKKNKSMLDNRIPLIVKAGGMDFTVRYPYHFIERTDIAGRIIFDEEVILITDLAESGKLATTNHAWRTFWHEMTHVIDKVYCANGIGTEMDNETLVDAIAVGIAQILSDNFEVKPKKGKK
jgi:hypothetical protein